MPHVLFVPVIYDIYDFMQLVCVHQFELCIRGGVSVAQCYCHAFKFVLLTAMPWHIGCECDTALELKCGRSMVHGLLHGRPQA